MLCTFTVTLSQERPYTRFHLLFLLGTFTLYDIRPGKAAIACSSLVPTIFLKLGHEVNLDARSALPMLYHATGWAWCSFLMRGFWIVHTFLLTPYSWAIAHEIHHTSLAPRRSVYSANLQEHEIPDKGHFLKRVYTGGNSCVHSFQDVHPPIVSKLTFTMSSTL